LESGSAKVEGLLEKTTELGLSIICFSEAISALNRKCREQALNNKDYKALKNIILTSIEDADIINITHQSISTITQLLENNALRTLDAIHIAAATEWHAELFVSADKKQTLAARNAGLKIKHIS